MYPDLSYLLNDLFGTPVDNWASAFKTFGLLLALAFVGAGWVVKSELKRLQEDGIIAPIKKVIKEDGSIRWKEIITNALSAGIIAMKLPFILKNFAIFQADPAGVIFSSAGNIGVGLMVAIIIGGVLYYFQTKEKREIGEKTIIINPYEKTGDILIIAAISGVFGAKLFSILENLDDFFRDPLGQLFSGSGLTIYGGLIVAFFAVLWYIKRLGIPTRRMMDIAGMGILVGYGIGRIGCQLSGDGDWGIVAAAMPEWWFLPDWLWSYNFPNNVNNDGGLLASCNAEVFSQGYSQLSVEQRCQESCGMRYCHELKQGVYPTSVYETVISFIFFGLLWAYRKKVEIVGSLFFLYMILNGIERFLIEFIRVNPKYSFMGMDLSQAQYISVAFVVLGFVGLFYLYKNKKKT